MNSATFAAKAGLWARELIPSVTVAFGQTRDSGCVIKKEPMQIDLIPDAWGRFERAVDAVVKGGPQHRTAEAHSLSAGFESARNGIAEILKEIGARPSWQPRSPD
jgi:hypothetical protein